MVSRKELAAAVAVSDQRDADLRAKLKKHRRKATELMEALLWIEDQASEADRDGQSSSSEIGRDVFAALISVLSDADVTIVLRLAVDNLMRHLIAIDQAEMDGE